MYGRNFLFVYPEVPDTYWSFKHALKFVGKKALMPPLGLATIAAMVPDSYSVEIIDLNSTRLSDDTIMNADLVLISAMLVQKDSFEKIIKRCQRLGVPVAAGGPYPTSCREEIHDVDYFILNEGEITFPDFLLDWERESPKSLYESSVKPPLDLSPVPRWDLFNLQNYNTLPLQFSRGCPFGCEFCDIVNLFGHVPRTKSPEQFLKELDAALSQGFCGNVFIVDDNFIGNKKAVKALLREITAWQQQHGYPLQFSTEASIDLANDEELLNLMEAAGFDMVFVGLETPAEESLREAGKKQNLQTDVHAAVQRIQSRGIEVTGGFIVGFDTDPEDIFEKQITFIQDLAVPTAMIGLLTALPKTRLYERLKKEDRILATSSGNNTHDPRLNFIPKLSMDVLIAGYCRILAKTYSPRAYFERSLRFLDRLPPKRTTHTDGGVRAVFSRQNLQAVILSFFRQTFSSYGFSYLRYLTQALYRFPDRIVRIITLAIQGHHLFIITKRVLHASSASAVQLSTGCGTISEENSTQPVSIRMKVHI